MKYIFKSLSSTRQFLFLLFLVVLSGFFQNCDRDDDEVVIRYHCLPENFINDCDAYQGISKSLGFGYTGMRAEAATFIPRNSHQILFTELDGDDASVPSKMVLYDWSSKVRQVLVEEMLMIHEYDITDDRMVCAEVSSGPIIYFHLDSASVTVKEVPFDGEIVRDPAWLSDGETIVYQTDSHDLKYRMVSYNIRTGFQREYKIPMDDIANILTYSMSSTDHFIVSRTRDGYYKVDFHDLTSSELLMSFEDTWPLSGYILLAESSRLYYSSPYAMHYGEDKVEWHVRALCFPYEEIHYMDVSDDEKFIVYMFEYPVEFRGGKQILASKLRIIDIENCKEYEINPFE